MTDDQLVLMAELLANQDEPIDAIMVAYWRELEGRESEEKEEG